MAGGLAGSASERHSAHRHRTFQCCDAGPALEGDELVASLLGQPDVFNRHHSLQK